MNQKIARQFRKLAKSMATEELKYGTLRNSKIFVPVKTYPQDQTVGLAGNLVLSSELKEPQYLFHQGTVVVNKASAKGIYKALKKAHRQ
jgi:hypothetical protein